MFKIVLRMPELGGSVERPCQLFQETLFGQRHFGSFTCRKS